MLAAAGNRDAPQQLPYAPAASAFAGLQVPLARGRVWGTPLPWARKLRREETNVSILGSAQGAHRHLLWRQGDQCRGQGWQLSKSPPGSPPRVSPRWPRLQGLRRSSARDWAERRVFKFLSPRKGPPFLERGVFCSATYPCRAIWLSPIRVKFRAGLALNIIIV